MHRGTASLPAVAGPKPASAVIHSRRPSRPATSVRAPSVRRIPEGVDVERIVLRPPPVLERSDPGGGVVGALPLVGSLGSIGLVATMAGGPRQYAGIALVVAATVLVAAVQLERQRRRRTRAADAERRDYLAHLAGSRAAVRDAASAQRAEALSRHPPPRALAALVECGSWHPRDGLSVRYGAAELPVHAAPAAPDIPLRADPFCAEAAR